MPNHLSEPPEQSVSIAEANDEQIDAFFLAPVVVRLCFRYGLAGEAAPLSAERYEFLCFLFERQPQSVVEIDAQIGQAVISQGGLWRAGPMMIRWESFRLFSPSRLTPIEANFVSVPMTEPMAELSGFPSESAALARVAQLAQSVGARIARAARPAGWGHLEYCESKHAINSELGGMFEEMRGRRRAELAREAIGQATAHASPNERPGRASL